jgi:cardiolipin synthase
MTITPIITSRFVEMVKPLIDEAKYSIAICVFDWRWYPSEPASLAQKFNLSILEAVARGVDVRVICNSQYVADVLKEKGAKTKKFVSGHLLHTKLMLIDEKITITGSHNYTQSAFSANYEVSVILDDAESCQQFGQFFKNIWGK